jgi:hypothetical protein
LPILSLTDIRSSVVHAASDYWRSKCSGERLPSRRDIDPVEIPRLLPHILLAEIWQEPFLVRYRLAGTALAELYGFDYTGSYLSREREGDEGYAYYIEIYRQVCRDKRPLFGRDSVHIRERHHIVYEWAEFPLVDNKAEVVMTFAVGELFRRPEDVR